MIMEERVNEIWYKMSMKQISSEEARLQVLALLAPTLENVSELLGALERLVDAVEYEEYVEVDARDAAHAVIRKVKGNQ
jgi:hypothetical protein